VALVVVIEPPGDLPEHGSGIRQSMDASVVALEGFDEGFSDAVRRGEARHQAEAAAKLSVSLAVKGLPLSDNHSTACGAWIVSES
jgi:hypothetical protein